MPHFALDDEQRRAIEATLIALKKNPGAMESAANQLALSLLQLNCYACHQRDKLGGVARGRDRFFEAIARSIWEMKDDCLRH